MGKSDKVVGPPLPTGSKIFYSAFKISMLSLGGGMSAWMFREYVIKLRWVSETDFLSDMAVARILPGTNISNMTAIMGYRLLGLKGAAIGFAGLLVGPFCLLILLLYVYDFMKGPALDAVLQGSAAGAIGPVFYLTYKSAVHGGNRWYTGLVLVAVAVAAVIKVPLLVVVAAAMPASIALTWVFWKP
jgi:chromate transporter